MGPISIHGYRSRPVGVRHYRSGPIQECASTVRVALASAAINQVALVSEAFDQLSLVYASVNFTGEKNYDSRKVANFVKIEIATLDLKNSIIE